MLPTTKAKQRKWVYDLIIDVHNGTLTRDDAIRRLHILLVQLRNRPPIKHSDPVSNPTTPAMKQAILHFHHVYPEMAHQTIAEQLNTNIGRVSEVLAGKRI